MVRPLDTATSAALANATIYPAWLIRLDILTDPVFVWTGIGPITLTGTGDSALDGYTFDGVAAAGEIGVLSDTDTGSQAVSVALAGCNLNDPAMRQIVYNADTWHYRQAWVWLCLFTSAGALIGKPVRCKTGRMDQFTVEETGAGLGTVTCTIESQQAYAGEADDTCYSEQKFDVDATDTSQDYAWFLSNTQPIMGQANAAPSTVQGLINTVLDGAFNTNKNFI